MPTLWFWQRIIILQDFSIEENWLKDKQDLSILFLALDCYYV